MGNKNTIKIKKKHGIIIYQPPSYYDELRELAEIHTLKTIDLFENHKYKSAKEEAMIVLDICKKLNSIHQFRPSDIKYKKVANNIINWYNSHKMISISPSLKKIVSIPQCLGIYENGKNKNQHCQAPSHPGSKYCLKHRNLENKKSKPR